MRGRGRESKIIIPTRASLHRNRDLKGWQRPQGPASEETFFPSKDLLGTKDFPPDLEITTSQRVARQASEMEQLQGIWSWAVGTSNRTQRQELRDTPMPSEGPPRATLVRERHPKRKMV